jgi:hypothetical protein
MSLLELLLLAAFIGFPLLQLLLEKLKGGVPPEPPPEEPAEEPPIPAARSKPALPPLARSSPSLPPRQEEGWSSGWGSWPTEAPVEQADEEDVGEEDVGEHEAEELIALQRRMASRQPSEAVRVSVPVVSLEALRVDRKAEHARLHARPASRPATVRRATAPTIGALLHSPADLRRAIVLAEVLGKPIALRDEG